MAHQENKKRKAEGSCSDSEDPEISESENFTGFVDLSQKYKCNDFNDIAQCFITLHQGMNKDLGSIRKSLSDMKSEIQDVKESVEINAQDIEAIKAENESLKSDLEIMGKSFMAKCMWSRKWNLVFRGIQGQLNEKPIVTEQKIRKFMEEKLGIEEKMANGMIFAACHRLKSGPDLRKNIIVRFVRLGDKDICLEKAFSLKKGCGYGVSQDLPPELAIQRAKLLKYREGLANEKKKAAKLVYLREHPFLILRYPGGQMEASLSYVKLKQN